MNVSIDDRTDIDELEQALDAVERGARRLLTGLSEADGVWRPQPSSWSIAQCLDHLATANQVYLAAMRPAAERARRQGSRRRGPAVPGIVGGWFVRTMEPPVKPRFKLKAPKKIVPRPSPPLRDAADRFFASQDDVRAFLRAHSDIDLARVRFANPFVAVLRWSLATGLHVIAAHERRHLWQAWNVLAALESAGLRTSESS
jgi:hypothetical protein